MKMLLVAIFTLSCAQISNATTPPVYPPWFPTHYTTQVYPTLIELPGYFETRTFSPEVYASCSDSPEYIPGVYFIQPSWDVLPFKVYCEIVDGKRWTIIQQRSSKEVDFFRNYTEYTMGFGPLTGNHWLGLEKIHQITKDGDHELLVELQSHTLLSGYARYSTFMVGSEATGFQLTISGYSGNAGDSMNYDSDGWNLNGMKFSALHKDQDNSDNNCAEKYKAGWWYNSCSGSNLNGLYNDYNVWAWETMTWFYNFGAFALKSARMMVRRK